MSITPFDSIGAIDEPLFARALRFLADAGVGVYVASQGSGEGDLLSFDEKVALYRIAVDELAGARAGRGGGDRSRGVDRRERARSRSRPMTAGVDAVQILGPRPGPLRLRDDELEAHFRAVIEAVDCDVHVSNNTVLAGYELPHRAGRAAGRRVPARRRGERLRPASRRVARVRAGADGTVRERVEVRVGMIREIVAMHALGAQGRVVLRGERRARTS